MKYRPAKLTVVRGPEKTKIVPRGDYCQCFGTMFGGDFSEIVPKDDFLVKVMPPRYYGIRTGYG